jgi:hypothetical protein
MNAESSTSHAFVALLDAARGSSSRVNAIQFALTWLAGARMVTQRMDPESRDLESLNTKAGWQALEEEGLPIDAVTHLLNEFGTSELIGLRAKALAIVANLNAVLGSQPWDVLLSLNATNFRFARGMDGVQEINTAVVDLLLDMAGSPEGWLWLPFDTTGAMTIHALRRGWKVEAAYTAGTSFSTLKFLLAIETGSPTCSKVATSLVCSDTARPLPPVNCAIAIPPIGELLRQGHQPHWNLNNERAFEHFNRSETWGIHESMGRATKRAIFLVPPGILFTKGQEQRFREFLLHRGGECNELEAVVALPPGALSTTNISTAILVTQPGGSADAIRMVDLGISKRSIADLSASIKAGKKIALGLEADESRARFVTRDEVMANDYILTPARYVHGPLNVGTNAVKLEDFCIAVRPPGLTKDSGIEMDEVGIPDIGAWRTIAGPFRKKVRLKSKGDSRPTLQPNDVILSVKGTIGKTGLVGNIETGTAVASQSCVALRLRHGMDHARVMPEYLLMYLRSDVGRAQLEGLQVGGTMQHVSPVTLLSSFRVPLPPFEEQRAVVAEYWQLCALEAQIADLEAQMKALTQQRWTVNHGVTS